MCVPRHGWCQCQQNCLNEASISSNSGNGGIEGVAIVVAVVVLVVDVVVVVVVVAVAIVVNAFVGTRLIHNRIFLMIFGPSWIDEMGFKTC